ncbi:uncharacterized protein LOC135378086 [Ornithodoros turicata]|uniref:uncharacterized protein LOC135378086 n=1 Tax=Ornithodoros turicata TaxID=34597 RepID=UPI003138CE82
MRAPWFTWCTRTVHAHSRTRNIEAEVRKNKGINQLNQERNSKMENHSDGITSSPVEKSKALEEWLFSLLGDDVQVYENDETSIRVLSKLMEMNKERDREAKEEILRNKEVTNVVNQEVDVLSGHLSSAGIKPSYLPRSLRCHLQALGSVACLGSSNDVSLESCRSTVTELQQQMSEIRDLVDAKTKEVSDLRERLGAQGKKLQAVADSAPCKYKEFEARQQQHMKNMRFYHAKQLEYEKKRDRLHKREVDGAFTHEEIVACHRNLEDLLREQEALQEQLKHYHGLQPDEATILHMLEQKRIERDTLEKELQGKISLDVVE